MSSATEQDTFRITLDNSEGSKLPEWKRTAFFQDGEVYVPAGIFDNEQRAFLCACYDGVGFVSHKGHAYLPASWIKQEYPKDADLAESVERRIRAIVATEAGGQAS